MNQEEQKEYQDKMGGPEMEYLQYQLENPNNMDKDNFDRMQMKAQEADRAMEDLIEANLDLLRDRHAENYTGTDDDMPDAFDNWLCDLTEADIIKILYNKEKE